MRLVSDSRRPVAPIARELGIPENVRYRWVNGQRCAHAQGTSPATLRVERDDLATLKRENLLLRQERVFDNVRRHASRASRNEISRAPGA